MGNINKHLTQLAKHFNLTNSESEKEEYVLTPEEEKSVIDNAIKSAQEYKIWKWKDNKLYTDSEIEEKVKSMDWHNEINRQEILAKANSNKLQDLWHTQRREQEKEFEEKRQKELIEQWTAKSMYRLMQWTSRNIYGKDLIVNSDNKPLITALCFFVARDPRFETELGYSFKKGLIIRGISGLGKTHLVHCLEKNELNPIHVLSMLEISDQIKHEGQYQIHLGDKKILYLDDVGTEEATVNHYGTKINFFKNFIEMIYLRNRPFNEVMFSTNNNAAEIEEKYGFRVRSRIKDMFNVIDIHGKDMRG